MAGELVLIVDDEANIVQLVRMYLERVGYRIETANNGNEALTKIKKLHPVLIVLDIMLPGIDGLEVLRLLRAEDEPILVIMLTARDDDIDKILGLEMGADDYLTKPFNPRELVARTKALLRRGDLKTRTSEDLIRIGNLSINPASREIFINNQKIPFRHQEFNLLQVLAEHKGLVLTREQLLNLAWGYDYAGQTRTVDVHIGHLRKKLAGSSVTIETVTSDGYKLVV